MYEEHVMDQRAAQAVTWAEALVAYSHPAVLQHVLQPDTIPQPQATSPTLTSAAEHHYQTPGHS